MMAGAAVSSTTEPGRLARANIAAGNLFFRVRNALFPAIVALIALVMRPRIILGDPSLDRALMTIGVTVALAGEAIRLLTIGFDYIDRGGKQGKVWASRLVHRGVYGIVRNPMYIGNALIVIGVCMAAGAPGNYLIMIPFFLFVYQAIVAAEEAYLRGRFGADYDDYCARVPRWLPRGTGGAFEGLTFQWRQALRKDLSTISGLAQGLIWMPLWRGLFLEGWGAARERLVRTGALSLSALAVYGLLAVAKRRKWGFYTPQEVAEHRLAQQG